MLGSCVHDRTVLAFLASPTTNDRNPRAIILASGSEEAFVNVLEIPRESTNPNPSERRTARNAVSVLIMNVKNSTEDLPA
jgi:hypothetical protein